MDSINYKNITEYKTELELSFFYARNKDRIICSCGKMIIKGSKWSHWKGKQHRIDTETKLLTTNV